jgi:hypothetical protein
VFEFPPVCIPEVCWECSVARSWSWRNGWCCWLKITLSGDSGQCHHEDNPSLMMTVTGVIWWSFSVYVIHCDHSAGHSGTTPTDRYRECEKCALVISKLNTFCYSAKDVVFFWCTIINWYHKLFIVVCTVILVVELVVGHADVWRNCGGSLLPVWCILIFVHALYYW